MNIIAEMQKNGITVDILSTMVQSNMAVGNK